MPVRYGVEAVEFNQQVLSSLSYGLLLLVTITLLFHLLRDTK